MSKMLDKLNFMNRAGRIDGLMVVLTGKEGFKSAMCGVYRDDPQRAINDASDSMQTLHTYAAQKRVDPMNATDIMGMRT